MNNQELLIYLFEAAMLFVAALFFFYRKRLFAQYISLYSLIGLFTSSIVLSLLSARIGCLGLEADSMNYLEDAKLLMNYLSQDGRLYGLFFLSGGNSIYPESYFPMLFASNTWANYSSFTIEKFFLFFSIISKPNLYNVSLFFGFISFLSKLLLIISAVKLHIRKENLRWLIALLTIGGIDIYFVSGLYKECVLFFFLAYILYYYVSNKRLFNSIFLCIILFNFACLKFEVFILFFISLLFFNLYKLMNTNNRIPIVILGFFFLIALSLSPFKSYVFQRIYRFSLKNQGNTALENFSINPNPFLFLKDLVKSFFRVFYTPLHSINANFWIIDFNNVIVILLALFLVYQYRNSSKSILNVYIAISLVAVFCIGVFVPNYGTILRYRAPFVVLILYGLILNRNFKILK